MLRLRAQQRAKLAVVKGMILCCAAAIGVVVSAQLTSAVAHNGSAGPDICLGCAHNQETAEAAGCVPHGGAYAGDLVK